MVEAQTAPEPTPAVRDPQTSQNNPSLTESEQDTPHTSDISHEDKHPADEIPWLPEVRAAWDAMRERDIWPNTINLSREDGVLADAEALIAAGHAAWVKGTDQPNDEQEITL